MHILLFLALTKPRGMLCPNGTVKPFLVSLVEPVAYLNLSYQSPGNHDSRGPFSGAPALYDDGAWHLE